MPQTYEPYEIHEVLVYDNIDDIYCRCCFNIFTPEDRKNKISESFLFSIREIFGSTFALAEGSKLICEECQDIIEHFHEFKKKFIWKQNQFRIYVSRNEHRDLMKIQSLMSDEALEDVREVIVKEEVKQEPLTFVETLPELPVGEAVSEDIERVMEIKVEEPEVEETIESPPVPKKSPKSPRKVKKKRKPQPTSFEVIPKVQTRYKRCPQCSKNVRDLLGHLNLVHGEKNFFKCSGCKFQGNTRDKVRVHIRNFHLNRRPCPICGKLVRSVDIHIGKVHENVKNFFCDLCDYSCYAKVQMVNHIQNHVLTNFKCPQCDFETSQEKYLQTHIRKRHESEEKPSTDVCKICERVFKSKYNLMDHIKRVHEKVSRFKCEKCEKTFFTRVHRKNHFLQHHDQAKKSFICDECGLAHVSASALRDHQARTHLKQETPCNFCGMICDNPVKLRGHIKRVHNPDKKYKCEVENCGAEYATPRDLVRHTKSKHRGVKFECQVPGCSSKLSRRDAYYAHIKGHHELSEREREELREKLKKFAEENDL